MPEPKPAKTQNTICIITNERDSTVSQIYK